MKVDFTYPENSWQGAAVLAAYQNLYQLVGAKKNDHFIFTSSGAEAVNHVVFASYLDITRTLGKNHFVTSPLEEAPTILSMGRLEHLGCCFEQIQMKGINLSLEAVREAFSPRTALLSLSLANGLIGVMNELKAIGQLCEERGVLFHIEVSHVLGKGAFSWVDCPSDFLSFHGEDMGAPAGTGGLFIREGLEISPLILGGPEQSSLRGGSVSLEHVLALGKAAKEACDQKESFAIEMATLRAFFEQKIVSMIPGAKILFQEEERVAHISCIDFPGVLSETLAFLLHHKGVDALQGGGRFQKLNLLLRSCGIHTSSALSFRFSMKHEREEILHACNVIATSVQHLRRFSKELVHL